MPNEEDEFFPVYCLACRKPYPRDQLDQTGTCAACQEKIYQQKIAAAAEAQRLRAMHDKEEAARKETLSQINTGKGKCPQCGSTNIQEITVDKGGGLDAREAACCIGCLFFLPLLLLAPFLKTNPTQEIHRSCQLCGYRWSL